METEGTHDARDSRTGPVPPAGPPVVPPPPAAKPPVPAQPPGRVPPRPAGQPTSPAGAPVPEQPQSGGSPVVRWLNTPRPDAGLGMWRYAYKPAKPQSQPSGRLAPVTIIGMVSPLLVSLFLWSLWTRGALPYTWVPLTALTPEDWWWYGTASPQTWQGEAAQDVYQGVVFALMVCLVVRLGSWPQITRHFLDRFKPSTRVALTGLGALLTLSLVWPEAFPGVDWNALPVVRPSLALVTLLAGSPHTALFRSPLIVYGLYALITMGCLWPFARLGGWWNLVRQWRRRRSAHGDAGEAAPTPADAPAVWPEVRASGQHQAADLLAAEVQAGRMNDVDCVRVRRAWESAQGSPAGLAAFTETVLRKGGAAWAHPSGARDLPARAARHDLLAGQVRIGECVDHERNPEAYRGQGVALDTAVLGTSLLAVGPAGSGKTRRLVRPVAESLALQALTGECAAVVVGPADTPLGPDDAYDVVVRLGDRASVYDLDLYADAVDPDEAALFLAEGLVGDIEALDSSRAATALAQLLGPYRAAHGRFPTVPVLRELLEGVPSTLSALRDALPTDDCVMGRELDARMRQAGTAADPGPAMADRLSLLDRPAFAEFFGGGESTRPFSLRAVTHHPLRVRIDLPRRGHEEASRLLTRLLLAQFTTLARAEGERKHFLSLVLDDATGALSPGTVQGIHSLRTANAGVLLSLRTVGDLPESLQGPLYGAVGCHMTFAGVSTWDGRRFAEAWGKEWLETEEVAKHTVFADQPMTRLFLALRKLMTGTVTTTDAVTVRKVERERWSASELAHSVPPGHAVLSLTRVTGEHAPPVLVDLRK